PSGARLVENHAGTPSGKQLSRPRPTRPSSHDGDFHVLHPDRFGTQSSPVGPADQRTSIEYSTPHPDGEKGAENLLPWEVPGAQRASDSRRRPHRRDLPGGSGRGGETAGAGGWGFPGGIHPGAESFWAPLERRQGGLSVRFSMDARTSVKDRRWPPRYRSSWPDPSPSRAPFAGWSRRRSTFGAPRGRVRTRGANGRPRVTGPGPGKGSGPPPRTAPA